MGNEDLYIDGEVEGTVELKGNSLTVGPNGNVHADVSAHSITILGRLQGNVKVGERTEIRKTGSFEGELLTAQIVSEDGAVFRGSIDIVKLGQNVAKHSSGGWPGPALYGSRRVRVLRESWRPRRTSALQRPPSRNTRPNGAYVLESTRLCDRRASRKTRV